MPDESFAAKVPAEQDPNWLFYSREAKETPRGSQGNEMLSKAVGNVFDTGVKTADKLMEDHVQDVVQDVEQRNREQFISGAENLASSRGVQRPNVLNPDTLSNAPPAVQQAVQRTQTVQAAADSGRLDKYGYYQRVIPELQAVRQQYPAYRHVVDQALGNNANAYMTTLIQEINRKDSENREDKRRQQGEVLSMAKEGYFGASGASIVDAFNNGRVDMSTILKTAAPFMARSAEAKAAQQNKDIYEWNKTQEGDQMSTEAGKQFSSNTAKGMIFPSVAAGQAEPTPDTDITKLKSRNVTPEENMAINQRLQAHRNEVYQQDWQWANTPWANGHTPLQTLGEEKVKGMIQSNLASLDAWISFSGDPKTFTLGDNLKNVTRMAQEGTMNAWMNNPDEKVRQTARASYALKEIMGPEGMAIAANQIPGGLPAFTKTIMTTDFVHAAAGLPDPTKGGATPSVGAQVEDMKKVGITDPVAYKGKIQMVGMIANPGTPDPVRRNIARYFFQATKENRDFISNFNSGYYENGRWHDGAEDVLRDLTDPRITKQIIKFGDPKLSEDYQNTVDSWFRVTAQRNIGQLNDALVATPPGKTINRVTGQRDPGAPAKIALQWDSEHNMLDLTPETRRALQQTTGRGLVPSYNRQILDSITRIQRYTSNMAHILETVNNSGTGQPRDIRTYILRLLQEDGLNIKDLPATGLIDSAIRATAQKPKQDLGNL